MIDRRDETRQFPIQVHGEGYLEFQASRSRTVIGPKGSQFGWKNRANKQTCEIKS